MRNARGHQGENERTKKKVNGKTYNISSIKPVTRKFLEGSRCSHAKKKKTAKKCTKTCAALAKLFFFCC